MTSVLVATIVSACSTGDIAGPRVTAATISIVSGSDQIGRPGELLEDPIVAQLSDWHGDPINGAALVFMVLEGGGTVRETSATTDDDGTASVSWTIGDGLWQTLIVSEDEARFVAMPVSVSARSERWVHISVVSGNDQTGMQGQQLPSPFVFSVTDIHGDPVPGVDVHFAITAGGGHLSQAVARTTDEGLAEVHSTLGTGAYQRIRASIAHEYWFARYAFTYAETQFVVDTSDARWITGITFRTVEAPGDTIPHDGRILESDHFLVFSDASSDTVRLQYADMAEESLIELLEAFHISSAEELGVYTDRPETKITIYCSAERDVYMHAFAYGFVLFDVNHSVWEVPWAPMRRKNSRTIVKHETMHVVQMLQGSGVSGPWAEVWFSEGIAEYVSGGSFLSIESWSQVSKWLRDETNTNPVTIRVAWEDIPAGGDPAKYYPMFGLAVEYLLDPKGRGRTLADVLNVLTDLGGGSNFHAAFEANMGLSVDTYRTQFFDLIQDFLAIY